MSRGKLSVTSWTLTLIVSHHSSTDCAPRLTAVIVYLETSPGSGGGAGLSHRLVERPSIVVISCCAAFSEVASGCNTIVDLDIPIWEGTQTGKSSFLHLP